MAGYSLFKNSESGWTKLNPDPLQTTTFTDYGLVNGSHTYRVTALDQLGNESEPSIPATAVINIVPPAPPLELTVRPLPEGSALEACWQTRTDAAGYNLYRGTVSGGPYELLAASPFDSTCHQDAGLTNGLTYYYVVTALDNLGNEGAYSNEASGTPEISDAIPGPPAAPFILTPVTGGGKVELVEPVTAITGLTETGSTVDLYRNGDWIATTQSREQDLKTYTPEGLGLYEPSPDGGRVIYQYHDSAAGKDRLAVYDFSTGEAFDLFPLINYASSTFIYDFNWAGKGQKIAVQYEDDLGKRKITIYDLEADRVYSLYGSGLYGSDEVWLEGWDNNGRQLLFKTGNMELVVHNAETRLNKTLSLPADYDCASSRWAPDGRQIELECYVGSLDDWIVGNYDLTTDSFTKVSVPGGSDYYAWGWSPDGRRMALVHWDDQLGYRLAMYDPQTGEIVHTDINEFSEFIQEISWSPDSSKLLVEAKIAGRSFNLYLYDPTDGSTSRILANGHYIYQYEWLPDSSGFLVLAYSSVEGRYYIYQYSPGQPAPVILTAAQDTSGFSLSPDGTRLAFTDAGQFKLIDLAAGSVTPYDYTARTIYWSQDSRRIAFTSWSQETGDTLWHLPLDRPEQAGQIFSLTGQSSGIERVSLQSDNLINVVTKNDFVTISPAGFFAFPEVPLPDQQNLFTAVAIDQSGNTGPPSEPITVKLAPPLLPDPEVGAKDLFVLPLSPTVGEQVRIEIAIRNNSEIAARDLGLEVYLQQAGGLLLLLGSESLPELGGNQVAYLDYTWDNTIQPGISRLYVILDPDNQLSESNEDNNFASLDFMVAAERGLELQASLNRTDFPADDVLNLDLSIANSGVATPVRVETSIEDMGGYLVAELPVISATLAYGEVDYELLAWQVGATYAGDYLVRITMRDEAGAVIDEKLLPFTIQPDLNFQARLVSDRLHYGPDQSVALTARLENHSRNYIASDLEAQLAITSSAGQLSSKTIPLGTLYNGSAAELKSSWFTVTRSPGNYRAVLTLLHGGQVVASASLDFIIDPVLELTGLLRVNPKVVPQGQPVQVEYGISSRGNIGGNSLLFKLVLADSAGQQLESRELNPVLAANSGSSGLAIFQNPLPLGNYRLTLYHHDQDTLRYLAGETFAVADNSAPQLEVVAPAAGLYHQAVDLSVKATDNGGPVQRVEYRLCPW